MRFDDTNSTKEKDEFIEAIKTDNISSGRKSRTRSSISSMTVRLGRARCCVPSVKGCR